VHVDEGVTTRPIQPYRGCRRPCFGGRDKQPRPTGDKAAGSDVVRSMAERAGAIITEAEGASHVPMMSQPELVTDVILTALAEATQREAGALNR
jgi:hypothetical protein